MERIWKELKSINKSNTSCSCYEEISLIIYIASLTQEEIITNEIEAASNILHCAFENLYKNHYGIIENILNNEERYIVLNQELNGNSFKIFIKDLWLFHIILINSLKHSDILNNSSNSTPLNFLTSVIAHILKNIDIAKPLSLHLLRTLLLIITKQKDILSPNLSLVILNHMNKVASSPITVFRQYAREISKRVIPSLPKEETAFLDVRLLPLRGIDMCDIVKRFSKAYIRENQSSIVKKVVRMFQRNVESKDGGALYECLLSHTFEEWQTEIWPLFQHHLKYIDYEGEFFQSLRKYWITMNVGAYKNDFYNFIRDEPIDLKLKRYILLESKRKGCTFNEDIIKQDVIMTFHDLETRDLALKLATTYHKRSLWPTAYEIDIVMNYLYSNTNLSLEEEESRSLRNFFSQIFLHAHNKMKKNEASNSHFTSVMKSTYKYCRSSLKTEFFEVGAEVTFILWTIATGSHKDLLLNYKLEKKDFYANGENLFYLQLKENDLWHFGSKTFQQELTNCFHITNGSSTCLTRLFTKYLDITTFVDTIYLKNIVQSSSLASLDTEKKITNYSEIVYQNQHCKNENLELLDEISDFVMYLKIPQESCISEDIIFKLVLYLEIITVARRYHKYNTKKLVKIVEKYMLLVENIVANNKSCGGVTYKTTKILEAFINKVMTCMIENVDILWENINKHKVMRHLIMVVQRSNMKRPLSLSVEVLKRFGSKMNENDLDMDCKIKFLDETLKLLYRSSVKSDLKIRRNPESRLVIHALSSSDSNPNKPLLKWVLSYLIDVISQPNTADATVASALHSIEILISDNSLQCPTLPYISDIIVRCVELFAQSSWIVRNADLQLTRAIIDRFYGVCLDVCNRPKCVEDLFILFPNLSAYFYDVLSCKRLDDRAILAFQFFSESQIKEHFCKSDLSRERFHRLFMDILQRYPNHYGKMAARSYSAICTSKEIPQEICSAIRFLTTNFTIMNTNIVANFMFLIQHLYEKHKNSFEYNINEKGIKVIDFALKDLLDHLRRHDTEMYDFILVKVKPQNEILMQLSNSRSEEFQKRLWLHNNIPFLLISAKSKHVGSIVKRVLSNNLPSCIQIKILTILISKLETNELDGDMLNEIVQVLFETSVCVDDSDNYLLNCYFKIILMFYRHRRSLNFKSESRRFKITSNIYKLMIFVLYFSELPEQLNDKEVFYSLIETKYMNLISLSEELRNDIISTLPYLQKVIPKEFKLKIFKLIFHSSLFYSSHLEAYKCITLIGGLSYSSILSALKDFFTVRNLVVHLKDKELVARFFNDVVEYLPEHCQPIQSDGYYSEESDILVPKLFLEKLINVEIRKTSLCFTLDEQMRYSQKRRNDFNINHFITNSLNALVELSTH